MTTLAFALELARPLWLLLLLVAPVFVWLTLRGGRGGARAGDRAALVARVVLLAALALALAAPRVRVDSPFRSVAYVLDLSDSIPAESQSVAREFVKRSVTLRAKEDDAAFVVFADGAAVEAPFTRISAEQRMEPVPVDPDHVGSVLPRGETDIEAALRLARAGFPPGGARRIVLVTDGNQTRGDARAAVAELVESGVDVQVVPLRYEREREVSMRKLVAPASAPEGTPVDVRAVIDSTHAGVKAHVRLIVSGAEVASNDVTLEAGRNVFAWTTAFAGAGFHSMEAVVEPEIDGDPVNNRGFAATEVRGPGRALVVTLQTSSHLADVLAQELGIPVDLAGAETLPADPSGYAPYDLVVLENLPAYVLSDDQRRLVASAVRELGVGLLCIGGDTAYGPGGYASTEIEEVLPVTSEVRNKRVLPSGALVVVLHTCEFAGGNEAARRITKAALEALSEQDEFGVVDWDGSDHWVVPLQRIREKSRLFADIDRAQPMDMPSFDSSIEAAEKALRASTAAAKHMVVISDGDPTPPSAKLAARLRDQRITISTVCVDPHSPGASGMMRALSEETGGRHYDVASSNISRLPQIFIKEAVTVRRSAWRDEPFQPQIVGVHAMLRGVAQDDLPPLRGYVVTTAKEHAQVLMAASEEDPLLAWWRCGLGEAAAWTSDAGPRWSEDWLAWGGFGRFWGQVARSVARDLERPGVVVTTDVEGGTATVVMDALTADGTFRNGLVVEGRALRPDGRTESFPVRQTAQGRYEGRVPAQDVGTHVLSLAFRDAGSERTEQALAAVCVSYSAEHLQQGSNERLFAEFEGVGATLVDPQPPAPADGSAAPDPAVRPWQGALVSSDEPIDVWPWIAAAAALILVLDVAVRRLRIKLPRRRAAAPAATAAPRAPPELRAARPRPSGAYVPPETNTPPAAPAADAPRTDAPAPPAPPAGDGGLLGAKRRAQRQQDWEENR